MYLGNIIADENLCVFQARNIEQKHRWCQEIKKLIIDNFPKSIPDRAKQVVLGGSSEDEKGKQRAGMFTCDQVYSPVMTSILLLPVSMCIHFPSNCIIHLTLSFLDIQLSLAQ